MKKNTIYVLIAVQVIIVLLFGSALVMFLKDRKGIKNNSEEGMGRSDMVISKEKEYDISKIEEIKLNFTSDRMTVYESSNEKLKVVQKSNWELNEQETFGENITDTTIEVHERNNRGFPFFFFGFRTSEMEIYLPKGYDKNLIIKETSGKIEVSTALNLASLQISNTSGGVELDGAVAVKNALEIKTVSGKVETRGMKANTVKVQTTSGRIEVGTTEVEDQYEMKSTSGRIEIESILGKGKLHTTSGAISVNRYDMTGDSEISSTSGRLELAIGDKTNCVINSKSTSGRIEFPNGINTVGVAPYQNLTLKTVSGSITVNK